MKIGALVFLPMALAYKVLIYSPTIGTSHCKFMGAIANSLTDAGHHVTILSPLVDPDLHASSFSKDAEIIETHPPLFSGEGIKSLLLNMWTLHTDIPVTVLASSQTVYDAANSAIGESIPYSSSPGLYHVNGEKMTLFERLDSLIRGVLHPREHERTHDRETESCRKWLRSNVSHWKKLVAEAAFFLTNSNPILDFPRPVLHKSIAVGGLTVDFEKIERIKLSEEWIKVLKERSKTVLVSFGSMARSDLMPLSYRTCLLHAFSSMPDVTFIWKYEQQNVSWAGNVENIHFSSWIPQTALLADSRLTAFLTHGGLGSITEVAHLGKPAVVVPLAFDQTRNARMLERHGSALVLPKTMLSDQETLRRSLHRIVSDPMYKAKSARLAQLLRNQPLRPSDLVVKYVEYAARSYEYHGVLLTKPRPRMFKAAGRITVVKQGLPTHIVPILNSFPNGDSALTEMNGSAKLIAKSATNFSSRRLLRTVMKTNNSVVKPSPTSEMASVSSSYEMMINPPKEFWNEFWETTSSNENYCFQQNDDSKFENFEEYYFVALVDSGTSKKRKKEAGQHMCTGEMRLRESQEPLFALGWVWTRPEYRGLGLVNKTFETCRQLSQGHNLFLLGVPDMSQWYAKRGVNKFGEGKNLVFSMPVSNLALSFLPQQAYFYKKISTEVLEDIRTYDEKVTPVDRWDFVKSWLTANGSHFNAIYDASNKMVGFCNVRETSNKTLTVEPVYADSEEMAVLLLQKTLAEIPDLGSFSNLVYVAPASNQRAHLVAERLSEGKFECEEYSRPQFDQKVIPVNSQHVFGGQCQCSLPVLPVPELEETLTRVLEYTEQFSKINKYAHEATKKAVEDFRQNFKHLHQNVVDIAKSKANWSSRPWMDGEFLRERSSLLILTTSVVALPPRVVRSLDEQVALATLFARGAMLVRDQCLEESEAIARGVGATKMCAAQFKWLYDGYREPGVDIDRIFKKKFNRTADEHIIVMFENEPYVVDIRKAGQVVSAEELFAQMKAIASRRSEQTIVPVSVATAAKRDVAAQFWTDMMKDAKNAQSLEMIKNAQFVICIDSPDARTPSNSASDQLIQALVGGSVNRFNRWYDQSLQFFVGANGNTGMAFEHSTADGTAIHVVVERIINYIDKNLKKIKPLGKTMETKGFPLKFKVPQSSETVLRETVAECEKMCSGFEANRLEFNDFGKNHIKSLKVSPDSFLQVALQLTFFRQNFRYGRTENGRSMTKELTAFLSSVDGDSSTVRDFELHTTQNIKSEKSQLLRKALVRQSQVVGQCKAGKGIDTHLHALEYFSRKNGGKRPMLFDDPLYQSLFRFTLLSSQTRFPDGFMAAFGVGDPQDYAVCYVIEPHRIVAHVSSDRRNAHPLELFEQQLQQSFRDLSFWLSLKSD
ncbi:unnamed protein product [Caenorhabditis auriculariae]|uniref:Choline O-acetyltransferase n=1 Tax=Caenorhabditis auriculariae TaxID=2777116 RepID=A0A8S1HGJ2_9PELO|nr:unnamed protein product [Caenorhabditis auriculariae]